MRGVFAPTLGLAALLALSGSAPAAEPLANAETVRMTSKVLGEERTILVSTPRGYGQGSARYPVLYLTDGDAHLLHTRGTVDFLVRNGLMPDVVIVGIANTDRTRDLTPTRGFGFGADGTPVLAETSGGAGKFLEFFEKELIPYVEATYRTVPCRVFAGHSLGGLFALDALVERPGLFNATIAASPSLNWDHDVILDRVSKFLDGRKELRHTLFVTMADEEEGDPSPTRFERLRKLLKGTKAAGFAWGAMPMPDEDHGSVVLRSHYWGLRKVFDGWRLPRDRKAGGFAGSVEDLGKHYAQLSERLGYPVPPPEPVVNQVGYQHPLRKDVKGALPFFPKNVELYPDPANVHDSLGEALEAAGALEEALASYERAVEIATRRGDPRLPVFARNRDRLAAAREKRPG